MPIMALLFVYTKMPMPQDKSACLLPFAKSGSIDKVRPAFRCKFNNEPPTHKQIHEWHKTFGEDGCVYKGKYSGHSHTPNENAQRIQTTFECSRRKSIKRTSSDQLIPQITVWHVLRKTFASETLQLPFLRTLHSGDHNRNVVYCTVMLQYKEDYTLYEQVSFWMKGWIICLANVLHITSTWR